MTTHDELRDDLSLFVLGGLAAAEAQAIESHLAEGCDECRAEVERWREVVGLLAFGAGVQAPPELKRDLLRRVGAEAQSAAAPAAARRPPAEVIPLRRWWPGALAAAAAVLLAYGITRDAGLRQELRRQEGLVVQLRSALDQASTDLAKGESALKQVRDDLAARERDVSAMHSTLAAAEASLALLQSPGLSLVRLKQTPDAKPAGGHVLISPSGKALFYGFDLAPLPAGKVYELWWITEKEGPVNAGLFQLDASGLGQVETAVPDTAGAIKAAAVTIEPEGGVPKPTGPMVLLGNV